MNATPSIDQLWSIAEQEAMAKGYRFHPECEAALRQLLGQATARLAVEPHRTDEAIANLRQLVGQMTQAPMEGLPLLPENSLLDALSKLCPLFPFC